MKLKTAKPANQDIHITLGIQPSQYLNLDKEIRMVKAAILYGDKVTLYSLKMPSILAISRFKDFPLNLQLEFFEKIIPYLSSSKNAKKLSSSLDNYKKILAKKQPDIHELQFKKEFEKNMEQNWAEIAEITAKFVKESQLDQIALAIKSGVLELHEFKDSYKDSTALNLMIESAAAASALKAKDKIVSPGDRAWIGEFAEDITRLVSDDSTYPLLDDETGTMATAGIQSKMSQAQGFGVDRGKQTELARYLIERLPLFEKASVNEILDIRRELEKPLTRFRGAIINFSDDIKSMPWGSNFPAEADKIYLRDVKPALLEIEEAIRSNKFLGTLVRKFKDKPSVPLLTMGLSQLSSLPKELATSLGFGLGSAALLYEAYEEWKKNKQDTEQNKLYFYYGVGERLKKGNPTIQSASA